MLKVNKNDIGKIAFLFRLILLLIILVFLYRVVSGSQVTPIPKNELVSQMNKFAGKYSMGTVMDRNGEIIVQGNGEEVVWGSETRQKDYEQILGIDFVGNEGSMYTVLMNCPWVFGLEDNRFRTLRPGYIESSLKGGDVQLTFDSDLQHYVHTAVEQKGYEDAYVMVSNYQTGEMYAIYGNAMQKSCPPGSSIKPFVAAAALAIDPTSASFQYDCVEGNHTIDTKDGPRQVLCVNNINHGAQVSMNQALAESCNVYFAALAMHVGMEKMVPELHKWGFDASTSFQQFTYNDSRLMKGYNDAEQKWEESQREEDFVQAVYGQANARMTPAGLNFCTNALMNHGVMVEPIWYRAKRMNPNGDWREVKQQSPVEICDAEVADRVVQGMMIAKDSGLYVESFAAKTGTAQNKSASTNQVEYYTVWITGGLRDEEHPISITVCLNQVPGSVQSYDAGVLAVDILSHAAREL